MTITRPAFGYSGQIFVAEEATYGTATTAAATKLRFPISGPAGSENKGFSDQRFFDGVNTRNMPQPQLGPLSYSDSFSQWLSDGWFLKMAFGSVTSSPVGTTTADYYDHTIAEKDEIPSFTLYDQVAGSGFSREYEGCKVSRYSISGDSGGFVTENVDFIAQNMRIATTVLTASAPDVEPFRWHHCVIKTNNAATTVAEVFENVNRWEVTIDNDLDPKMYCTDTGDERCISAIHEQGRNYNAILNVDFTDRKHYDAFFTGTTGGVETTTKAQGTTIFDFNFNITMTRSATTTKDEIFIGFKNSIIDTPGFTKDVGNTPITLAMAIRPLALDSCHIYNSDASPWS